MCAIMGFAVYGAAKMNLETVAAMVRDNIARGPHAYGFAWIDSRGRLRCYKQPGRLTDHLHILPLMADCKAMILHLRHATHGRPAENINNHPHPCDGGWIIHNGFFPDYHRLIEQYDLWPSSECDSEVIGLLIEESKKEKLTHRIADAMNKIPHHSALAMLGLWRHQLVAVRRTSNPLHEAETPEGIYFATLPGALPGEVRAMALGEQVVIDLARDGSIRETTRSPLPV